MENLLLPTQENHEQVLLAMLNEQISSQADFVPRKGQSRVILLHGESSLCLKDKPDICEAVLERGKPIQSVGRH